MSIEMTQKPIYIGRTKEPFHGMPAGTEVKVIDQYRDVQDTLISKVARVDGGMVPTVGGEFYIGSIADSLIEEIKE